VTSHRPGPHPDPARQYKIGDTKLEIQNWRYKIGYDLGLGGKPVVEFFAMPIQGEVVDAPFRANRRLMFVMRRFLYISISIQMLLYCIFRFVVRYTFPYWASWMICSGFGVQTIALILLLAILPEIRVYARRKFFCEWMDPDRPRDHGHFTKNPNSWLTEFINFTELHNLEACIK
jgi:hypothetical protein